MAIRFLIPPAIDQHQIQLDAERSHYLCRVLRKREGENIDCFDGQGGLYAARILKASTKQVTLELQVEPRQVAAPVPIIHLALSILKGQAMDRALQQATELGVTKITLLNAARCNVALKAERATNKLQHWQKIIAGACEQCGQLFLPTLNAPVSVSEFIQGSATPCWVMDQNGSPFPGQMTPQDITLLIGPEGRMGRRRTATVHRSPAPPTRDRAIHTARRNRTGGGISRCKPCVSAHRVSYAEKLLRPPNCASKARKSGIITVASSSCNSKPRVCPCPFSRGCKSSSRTCTVRGRASTAIA